MGARRPPTRPALAAVCFAAIALLAAPASAQTNNPYGTRAERGFGNRDSFVFSVENVFGFQHLEFGQSGSSGTTSIDTKVMHPFFWGNVGFFGVYDSGLSLGGLVGVTHEFVHNDAFNPGHDFTILRLKPRVGYAGSVTPFFGYWVRGGPSLFSTISGDSKVNIFSFGGEAYAVVSPVPHFGILIGPNADIYIYGRDNHGKKESLTAYGLTCGLMGEFW